MKKAIIAFIAVFMFIQLCEIYIMGGFYYQTILSKSLSVIMGVLFGAGVMGGILSDNRDEK